MLITELISETKQLINERLSLLYRARDSMKDDWRFEDLNAYRNGLIKELEEKKRYYDANY